MNFPLQYWMKQLVKWVKRWRRYCTQPVPVCLSVSWVSGTETVYNSFITWPYISMAMGNGLTHQLLIMAVYQRQAKGIRGGIFNEVRIFEMDPYDIVHFNRKSSIQRCILHTFNKETDTPNHVVNFNAQCFYCHSLCTFCKSDNFWKKVCLNRLICHMKHKCVWIVI